MPCSPRSRNRILPCTLNEGRDIALNTHGRYITAYPPLLLAAWIAAWTLNVALRERLHAAIVVHTINNLYSAVFP
jgi:hypothetical protein